MIKKYSKIKDIILPNKKVNYFIFSIIIIGFITGAIFLTLISENDKDLVVESITSFFSNINKKNTIDTLKNIGVINAFYVFIIWILSFSLIGLLFNIFLVYLRSFILGFIVTAIIYTYKFKAILAIIFYIVPSQLINLFVIYILGIYSIIFTFKLIGQVTKKNINVKSYFKKYFYILLVAIILSIISTILETFLFPLLLKLIIKLYI